MSKRTAKAKKVAKKAGSALRGDTGIIRTLKAEHAEVSALMDDCLEEGEASERRELYELIRKKLIIHTKCEELEFYPICQEETSAGEIIDQSRDEHDDVERMLVQLDGMNQETPGWEETFDRMRAAVEEHVDLEENRLFPIIQEEMDSDRLRELDDAFKERKRSIESRIEDLPTPHETHAPR